jgi:hypothetical protein
MKNRVVLLVTMGALMVGMLAMSVAPAFAAWDPMTGCKTGDGVAIALSEFPQPTPPSVIKKDRNGDGFVCRGFGGRDDTRLVLYDNRQ